MIDLQLTIIQTKKIIGLCSIGVHVRQSRAVQALIRETPVPRSPPSCREGIEFDLESVIFDTMIKQQEGG